MKISIIFQGMQGDRETVTDIELSGQGWDHFPAIVRYRDKLWRNTGAEGHDTLLCKEESCFEVPFSMPSEKDQVLELLESAAMDFAKLYPFCGDVATAASELYKGYVEAFRPTNPDFCPICAAQRRYRMALQDLTRLQAADSPTGLSHINLACPEHPHPKTQTLPPATLQACFLSVGKVDMANLLAGWAAVVHTTTKDMELRLGHVAPVVEVVYEQDKPVLTGRTTVAKVLDIVSREPEGDHIKWAVQMQRTLASYLRQERPTHGGDSQTVLAVDWKLWTCCRASGHETLIDWGPEWHARAELRRYAAAGHDVWLIDPYGHKHLPTTDENPVSAPSTAHD